MKGSPPERPCQLEASGFYKPKSSRSGCWHFFVLHKDRQGNEKYCLLCQQQGQHKPVKSGSGTLNMYSHLRTCHGIQEWQANRQARGECDCGKCPPGGLPHVPVKSNGASPNSTAGSAKAAEFSAATSAAKAGPTIITGLSQGCGSCFRSFHCGWRRATQVDGIVGPFHNILAGVCDSSTVRLLFAAHSPTVRCGPQRRLPLHAPQAGGVEGQFASVRIDFASRLLD